MAAFALGRYLRHRRGHVQFFQPCGTFVALQLPFVPSQSNWRPIERPSPTGVALTVALISEDEPGPPAASVVTWTVCVTLPTLHIQIECLLTPTFHGDPFFASVLKPLALIFPFYLRQASSRRCKAIAFV